MSLYEAFRKLLASTGTAQIRIDNALRNYPAPAQFGKGTREQIALAMIADGNVAQELMTRQQREQFFSALDAACRSYELIGTIPAHQDALFQHIRCSIMES